MNLQLVFLVKGTVILLSYSLATFAADNSYYSALTIYYR